MHDWRVLSNLLSLRAAAIAAAAVMAGGSPSQEHAASTAGDIEHGSDFLKYLLRFRYDQSLCYILQFIDREKHERIDLKLCKREQAAKRVRLVC